MKFTHATHLLDADDAQVTTGVTRSGDLHLLIQDGTGTTRLTPELADRLADILRDYAKRARGRYWAPLRSSEPCPRCGAAAGELHRKDCGTALREQLTRTAEPDTSCPDCHVPVAAEHTEMCGARDSGQIIWPGYVEDPPEPVREPGPEIDDEDDEPEPWRCPECRTLLRYLHDAGCSMANPGPVAPSPWGHPEPAWADDPDEPTNRDIEPEPDNWYDVDDSPESRS